MFNNIGKKIKALAKAVCWIGIIFSWVLAIVFAIFYFYFSGGFYDDGDIIIGLLVTLVIGGVGTIFSWLGSFFTYGFGELVDKTQEIAINTSLNPSTFNKQHSLLVKDNKPNQQNHTDDNDEAQITFLGERETKFNDDTWTCPECVRVNPIRKTICKCGYKREK